VVYSATGRRSASYESSSAGGVQPPEHPAVGLTPREREIALLAAAGESSREIADRLVISVRTVDNHLQNAYRKLGVTRRQDLPRVLGGTPD
jgi:DNA-binding CsgD family transcriptional regulator